MPEWYVQLPQRIDPIAFYIGTFGIRWYAVMWIIALCIVWGVTRWRIARGEVRILTPAHLIDALTWAFLGAVIGGRLGYALFYDAAYFVQHPLALISPVRDGVFVGITGMSFHGGVVGITVALWLWARRTGVPFLRLADAIAVAAPFGYAFGRIGNFLNHELWGRVTTVPWGMFFGAAPDGGTLLRHPSQLYEAVGEGVVIGALLWFTRHRIARYPGMSVGVFLIGYSVVRFCLEYVRAPDAHLGFVFAGMTMGQALSFILMGVGGILVYRAYRRCSGAFL